MAVALVREAAPRPAALVACIVGGLAAAWVGAAMDRMGALPMPGGWLLPAIWTRGCGPGWPDAAAHFMLMWTAMAAGMAPLSLQGALDRSISRRVQLAAGVGAVWTALGLVIFVGGGAAAWAVLRHPGLARLEPALAGLGVIAAGAAQLSGWKGRQLRRCERVRDRPVWCEGLILGLRCCACCAPITATMLLAGMMNPWVMAGGALATAAERWGTHGLRSARVTGVIMSGLGLAMLGRAIVTG